MAKPGILFYIFLLNCFALSGQNNFEEKQNESYILKMKISGKLYANSDTLNTGYSQNNIEMVLKPLEGGYSYRVVEIKKAGIFEGAWLKSNEDAEVLLMDVKPGTYRIEFQPFNKGANTVFIDSVYLIVKKPWWRSLWFWALCFLSLFSVFYGRERFLKNLEDEEELRYKRISELELRTLQLQMNPHFIFNALNSIQSFIMTNDTFTANDYLSKFANLIRMFLESSRSKYISISEEINLLRTYTEIESLRFDDKFDLEIEVADSVNKFIEIPTMLLQPFVENAINHGLRYKKDRGFLKIKFSNVDDYIVCTIIDNGVGRKNAERIQTKSIKGYKSQGLSITAERLATYNSINNSNIEFRITNLIEQSSEAEMDLGTMVEIKFPKPLE